MIGVVAGREYVERVRSRAFILATVFTIVIFGGVILLPRLFGGDAAPTVVGYLDEAGDLATTAARLDAVAAAEEAADEGTEAVPRLDLVAVVDRAAGEASLRRGTLDVLLVDATTVVVVRDHLFSGGGVPGAVRQAARVLQLEELIVETGISGDELATILGAGTIAVEALEGDGLDESRSVIAYAGMMLTYVALLMYGTWTLIGVTEEKSSRVVEIIISAIRPSTLLAGKVLGIGMVAVTQLTLVFLAVGGILYAIGLRDVSDVESMGGPFDISLADVPLGSMGMLVLWFIVGFSLYNVLFAAVGSLVSRVEDAQNANIPLALAVVGSLVLSVSTLGDPTGPAAMIGTYLPFSAPFVVPVRYALEAISAWEVLASLTLSIVTLVVLVRIAGRIYEGAILRAGGRVKVREAWRGDR